MEGMEQICFEMISSAGAARSSFIEAIENAKSGHLEEARKAVEEGEKAQIECHKVHQNLITQEASGKPAEVSLLLVHAEDQLMAAELFQILAQEWIDLYTRLEAEGK